jgi:hypothetical protein
VTAAVTPALRAALHAHSAEVSGFVEEGMPARCAEWCNDENCSADVRERNGTLQ